MIIARSAIAALAAGLLMAFAAQPGTAGPQDEETLEVTFILHCCEGITFWEPMLHGINEAGSLFNVNVDVQNADGDPERNKNLIETAIANKVDGIVSMVAVEDVLTESIQDASDAGIAVITANVDDPEGDGPGGTARLAFVGQDFAASGYRIGKRMVEKYGLKEGDFCVVPSEQADLVWSHLRYSGVKKALDEAGVASEVLATGTVLNEAKNILAEYLVARPETDCIITLGYVNTQHAPQAAEEAGMEGLPNGGFDTGSLVLENIIAGLTEASMDQQPFWQGFLPVMYIAYNVRYGLAPVESDTGMGLIDLDNAHLYPKWVGTYR
jgi:simple sugar transport system substrate-binding protein